MYTKLWTNSSANQNRDDMNNHGQPRAKNNLPQIKNWKHTQQQYAMEWNHTERTEQPNH
uniref:Uncharacterized protein n=1 Tax=Arundo donax TaxID=35708 RepID=A0A0A9HB94_ARUDO